MFDDHDLDRLLKTGDVSIPSHRIWCVRRAILLGAAALPIRRHFIFGFHPALAAATAMFGLVLGFSMPQIFYGDASTGAFDITSQSFNVGIFG